MSEDRKTKSWLLYVMIFGAIILWLANLIFAIIYFPNYFDNAGLFGDVFGAVNALFAGLAFAGFIYAIYLQKQELSLQHNELKLNRVELELTRKELEDQKNQLKAQNATWQKQNFENTFFQLLSLNRQVLRNIGFGDQRGLSCFEVWHKILTERYRHAQGELHGRSEIEIIEKAFHDGRDYFQRYISSYYMTLYNVFKFIARSEIDDKKFYTNLIRAHLSDYELIFIFYNCLTPIGEKLSDYAKEYSTLKHINVGLLLNHEHEKILAEHFKNPITTS